jgi:replicative superfamily II helicase
MYMNGDIKVLVATATLAWGVNLPARLVIVKGTEYFDGKTSRYVDYPLTDVLQMIGRAGRPGFDTEGVAVVLVEISKKNFYKKFLYQPFPVESCLEERLCENLNAEIATDTVKTIIDAVGYLSWTFYARRLRGNPTYYGAKSSEDEDFDEFLLAKAKETVFKLKKQGCVEMISEDDIGEPLVKTSLGIASSNYYLNHRTPKQMQFGAREARKMILEESKNAKKHSTVLVTKKLVPFEQSERVDEVSAAWILYSLSCTHEFDELPVRHNEEILNEELSEELMWGPDTAQVLSNSDEYRYVNPEVYADPHTKCFLLLQAYIEGARLPISDYVNDTKSVIENVPRLLAAMIWIGENDTPEPGSLDLICQFHRTRQIFETRSPVYEDPLAQLNLTEELINRIRKSGIGPNNDIKSLQGLRSLGRDDAANLLKKVSKGKIGAPLRSVLDNLYSAPVVKLEEASAYHTTEKASGTSKGHLKVTMSIERESGGNKKNRDDPLSLYLVLGSWAQKRLLAHVSVPVNRSGSWNITREIDFDWNMAKADAGDNDYVVLRFMFDGWRGMDSEVLLTL